METDINKELEEVRTELRLLRHLVEANNNLPDELGYYTGKQVEKILAVTERTLSTYRKRGDIKSKQFGLGTYRYPKNQPIFNLK